LYREANSDTLQDVIWAFGTTAPSSPSPDVALQQHLASGTLQLDLTKTGSGSASAGPSSTSSGIPLLYYQKLIVAHAILCVVGFLAILPAGALLARYLRTRSPAWFKGHEVLQAFIGKLIVDIMLLQDIMISIAGPFIIAGVSLGIQAVNEARSGHVDDTHKVRCFLAVVSSLY
jgi:hypothetical protein